jgi:hypothetical protein
LGRDEAPASSSDGLASTPSLPNRFVDPSDIAVDQIDVNVDSIDIDVLHDCLVVPRQKRYKFYAKDTQK